MVAAGYSRRMGLDKRRQGQLLATSVRNIAPAYDQIVIVLRKGEQPWSQLMGEPYHYLQAAGEESLGSSIASGAQYIQSHFDASQIAVHLADMPWLTADVCNRIAQHTPSGCIGVPTYLGANGHPVIFDALWLEQLASLWGQTGAKSLITQNADHVETIEVTTNAVLADIDTPAQLAQWLDSRLIT